MAFFKNKKSDRVDRLIKLYELSQLARFRGLLILEDYLDIIDSPEIKEGLKLIINGTGPENVKLFFDSLIDKGPGKLNIETVHIYRNAILGIQSGERPFTLLTSNFHLLKQTEEKKLLNRLIEFEKTKRDFFQTINEKDINAEIQERVNYIFSLEFVYRTGLTTSGLDWNVLARALAGCARDIQIRIIDLMPDIEVRSILKYYKNSYPDTEEILKGLHSVISQYNLMMSVCLSPIEEERLVM